MSISSAYAETKMMRVYTKFSDKEIVDLLKETFNVTIEDKGVIKVKDKGTDLTMLIDNKRSDGSLSFYFFRLNEEASYKALNAWNSNNPFLKAYNMNGDFILQNELRVGYGIGEEYLANHVSTLFLLLFFNRKDLAE